jgi:hypothetical protein
MADIDLELINRKMVLFPPSGRKDLRSIHPEMESIQAFKNISSEDLLFSWYYACASSPLRHLDKMERIADSCKKAYPKKSETKIEELTAGFPESIREAVRQWEMFDIGSRARSQLLAEHSIRMITKILQEEPKESLDTDGVRDYSKVKDWMAAQKVGHETLGSLVRQIENGGYGLKESSDEDLVPGELAQYVHNQH